MNKSNLTRLAQSAGATLEEDTGYRDMRCFQIVAPDGKRWVDGGVTCIRIEWATGSSLSAREHNEAEYLVVKEAVEFGLEDIPEFESYLYATD